MNYKVTLCDATTDIQISAKDSGYLIKLADGSQKFVRSVAGNHCRQTMVFEDGSRVQLGIHVDGDRFAAQVQGEPYVGDILDPRRMALSLGSEENQGDIRTPMPGAVVRVPVQVGQPVSKGDVLIVVEAMKMENEFKSPISGTIAKIAVAPGETVEANALLVQLSEQE